MTKYPYLLTVLICCFVTTFVHWLWMKLDTTGLKLFQQDNTDDPFCLLTDTIEKQYDRFWRNNPQHQQQELSMEQFHALVSKYTVRGLGNISFVATSLNYRYHIWSYPLTSFLTVRIDEYYMGKPTHGGSSFVAILNGSHLSFCGYMDHFNGSYTVTCQLKAECNNFSIVLNHVNFTQYAGVTKRLDRLLYHTDICKMNQHNQQISKTSEFKNTWIKQGHSWIWKDDRNKSYPLSTQEISTSFCSTIKKFQQLILIGASHMMRQKYYIIKNCQKTDSSINSRIIYIDARYSDDVTDALNAITDPKNHVPCKAFPTEVFSSNIRSSNEVDLELSTKVKCQRQVFVFQNHELLQTEASKSPRYPDLDPSQPLTICHPGSVRTGLLVQTGSWDLSHSTFKKSMEHAIPLLETTLLKLKTKELQLHTVVMSPPSWGPKLYVQCRNNDMILFFTAKFQMAARKAGLDFVNVFKMLYPRFKESVLDGHYLECIGSPQCEGDLGKVAIQVAIEHLNRLL